MPLDGTPRPDHGPGFVERVCASCRASWVGHCRDGEWCPWCEKAVADQVAQERRLLLDPPWLRSSEGADRYAALSDDAKAVWDRTRGQKRGGDSVLSWMQRLARAVDAGWVDEGDARAAIRKVAGR